jgi:hypothetical protein
MGILRHSNKKIYRKRIFNISRDYLPECNSLSQFAINDKNIYEFKRNYIHSPGDCFINALQLLGYDSLNSNILRVSIAGRMGFYNKEIELIFTLLFNHHFCFKNTNNYYDFYNFINVSLYPGHAILAGYNGNSTSHVFILARNLQGKIIYIEPQLNLISDLNECSFLINNSDNLNFQILFNSSESLTKKQLKKLGFM